MSMKINETYVIKLPKPNMDGIMDVVLAKQHVFIRDGIENEKVEITTTKRIKEGFIGKITRVIEPSKNRIANPCPHTTCGGCSYNHMNYDAECKLKCDQIKELYKNEKIKVHPVTQANNSREYRNKCIYTFQKVKKEIKFGFYEENSHRVIDIPNCINHDELTMKILKEIKKLVIKYKIEIFDEDRLTGIMRHVLIRRAFATNQTLVCFVVASDFKGTKNFVSSLIKQVPEITTVVFNQNARKTSVVLGDKEKVMYGKGYIVDELCGHTYKLSANTFYQINHDQTERLYNKAIELCEFKGYEKVLDMYCGVGTIGMSCANSVKEVIGVEINTRSIQDAINNAKMNQVNNIQFIAKDASTFMKDYAKKKEKVDVVIMDPPRSGSDIEFIRSCVSMNPKKVLYISCNPLTQYRDLQIFRKFNYDTKEIYLFDLFPHSSHVESVCILTRKH